ncbi:MAG: acyl-CoA dehydrogenase family protein [Bordetella sp.]|nr:acyl-CoA dehydrogenase family protein [Bordetella sp.]
MEWPLSPEQGRFRAEVRAFIDARLPSATREKLRAGRLPSKEDTVQFQRALHERGWAAPHWPRRFGGAELGVAERMVLLDEIFRAPAPLPSVFNLGMLGPVLMRYGTPQQCERFLPRLASLDLWFCQGFSEPGAGSDLAALATSARREAAHYVVNGQKIWTTDAHLADWAFCLVRTGKGERRQEGISFVLVDLRLPGIRIRPIVTIDGHHKLNAIFFDDVEVPLDCLVGEEGQGWEIAKFLLSNERSGIASVGLCRERLDHALGLAASIVQDGRPLLDDAALRAELAGLDAAVRALEITNWRLLLDPQRARAGAGGFASALKLAGTELRQAILALVARLAGPSALTREVGVAQAAYLQSRACSIFGGASEVQRDLVARAVLH